MDEGERTSEWLLPKKWKNVALKSCEFEKSMRETREKTSAAQKKSRRAQGSQHDAAQQLKGREARGKS
jgi:hypothetical protein